MHRAIAHYTYVRPPPSYTSVGPPVSPRPLNSPLLRRSPRVLRTLLTWRPEHSIMETTAPESSDHSTRSETRALNWRHKLETSALHPILTQEAMPGNYDLRARKFTVYDYSRPYDEEGIKAGYHPVVYEKHFPREKAFVDWFNESQWNDTDAIAELGLYARNNTVAMTSPLHRLKVPYRRFTLIGLYKPDRVEIECRNKDNYEIRRYIRGELKQTVMKYGLGGAQLVAKSWVGEKLPERGFYR